MTRDFSYQGGMPMIDFADFAKLELRVGTVLAAETNVKARHPAYVLHIDFGAAIGIRTSSAQITAAYAPGDLIGRQIVAVMNFAPKRVAGVKSEVLVLAAMPENAATILLVPTHRVENGTLIG
jgi:tRNA-binding protein